jgi:hypothetical protein
LFHVYPCLCILRWKHTILYIYKVTSWCGFCCTMHAIRRLPENFYNTLASEELHAHSYVMCTIYVLSLQLLTFH